MEGDYICSPCGYRHHYHTGERFGECTSCMAGTEEGHPDYIEGTGLWEKASDEKPPESKTTS